MSALIVIGVFVTLFVLAMNAWDDRQEAEERARKGYRDDD